jgi:hypothetical protein
MAEEIGLLCLLHNIGATRVHRSLTTQEIANLALVNLQQAAFNLEKLVEADYLQDTIIDGTQRYHLTPNGIRKVLSMYS